MSEPTEPVFLLPDHVRQSLVNYLADRPYKEVHEGIAVLAQLEQHEPKEKQ